MAGHLWGAKCKMSFFEGLFSAILETMAAYKQTPHWCRIFLGKMKKNNQTMAKNFLTIPSQKSEPSLLHKTENLHPKTSNQQPSTSISQKNFRILEEKIQPQILGLKPVLLEEKGKQGFRVNFGVAIRFWSLGNTRRARTKFGEKSATNQPLGVPKAEARLGAKP